MRTDADAERVRAVARELGRVAREDTTLYLTGGATAVLEGWRPMTKDVDLRLEPDSDELNSKVGESSLDGSAGVTSIVVWGAAVSTVHV